MAEDVIDLTNNPCECFNGFNKSVTIKKQAYVKGHECSPIMNMVSDARHKPIDGLFRVRELADDLFSFYCQSGLRLTHGFPSRYLIQICRSDQSGGWVSKTIHRDIKTQVLAKIMSE